MNAALLLILIIIGNLSLYWLFFGKKIFEQKYGLNQNKRQNKSEAEHGRA